MINESHRVNKLPFIVVLILPVKDSGLKNIGRIQLIFYEFSILQAEHKDYTLNNNGFYEGVIHIKWYIRLLTKSALPEAFSFKISIFLIINYLFMQ